MRKFNRVMIVDDNEIDRYVADRVMKKYGFTQEVIICESARNAMKYLYAHANKPSELPELIFLDIRMPEIDGFGFLDMYNFLPDEIKLNCAIIMLSTSLDPKDHERAMANKYVTWFLRKPLTKEILAELAAT